MDMECAKHRELFGLHSTVTGKARSKHNALATLVVKWQPRFCIKHINNGKRQCDIPGYPIRPKGMNSNASR